MKNFKLNKKDTIFNVGCFCFISTVAAQGSINFEKFYLNAETQRLEILNENEGKSGIYLWENRNNRKLYVGSSIDLKRRLTSYYNLKHLAKYPTRYINNALLKDGHTAFSLYILELCNPEDLISREQYYFDLLDPEYNICKTAGSSLGRLHSEESKEKISKSKLNTNLKEENHFYGHTHTEEAKEKMVNSKLSKALPTIIKKRISETMLGRKLTEEHKINLSLSKKNSKKLFVLDLTTNQETLYNSISQAERSLGLPKNSIRDNLKSKTGAPYRGKYKFSLAELD